MLEPPTLIAGLHDVAVMRQPVQQGRGHLGIPKHIAPFREVQVGCDHHAGALVQLGEQVKQQCPTGLGEWQIAHLVHDHHVHVHQPVGHLACLVLRLLQLQGVDQLDRGEEPHAFAMRTDGLNAQAGGQMGFARARASHQHHVVR
jgi:hypothetical protein